MLIDRPSDRRRPRPAPAWQTWRPKEARWTTGAERSTRRPRRPTTSTSERARRVVLLHGSGPGSSAYSNWRLAIPALAAEHRCLAPDLSGFGRTTPDRPPTPDVWRWADEVLALLDALAVERVDVVGNSMGGAVALALAVRAPERVRRIVTMGSVGVPFELTPGLDAVWGYRPSLDAMRDLVRLFAFDPRYAEDDDLVRLRYEGSADPVMAEQYAALFPAPRQRWVDASVIPEASLRTIRAPLLAVHGRDDRVVPLETSDPPHRPRPGQPTRRLPALRPLGPGGAGDRVREPRRLVPPPRPDADRRSR
ncbi:MAG: hypothetical protein KatS3mg065_1022 [Chloroflexota bacterium]|nr:MAG: hypothetical protein KatS3mg065_1022 [Chloroflexota bacterium]